MLTLTVIQKLTAEGQSRGRDATKGEKFCLDYMARTRGGGYILLMNFKGTANKTC